ncbi:ABC transporter permease [Dactylosporangium sp. AC04546]|uniref:ABC transporter permease n=1 Tax=Dactylosporangium sp. AC04546 TaxID=2862460 RepID=UPI001EDF4CDF|nr:ABC transporter permease [Dactylosporangium sp. AC04546]WVK80705.1 ABC transporter permease [Dactylosporangium sp. AC04546]
MATAAQTRVGPQRRPARTARPKVSVFTLVITVLLLLPLVVVAFASLNPDPYLLFPPERLSLRWFSEAFAYPSFRTSLTLSLRIASIVVAVGLLITVPAAVALTRGSRRIQRTVQLATATPLVTPDILLALGLLIMLSQLSLSNGLVGLVLGHVLVGLPIALQVLVAGLAAVDSDLESAAATLGASRMRAFACVTLPSMLPAIGSAAVFLFIFSFDNVSISLFLSSPGQTTLPITLFQYLEHNADPTVAAMSTILVIVGIAAALLLGRLGGLGHLAGGAERRRR